MLFCASAIIMCAVAAAQAQEKIHELKASPATVHRGFFDASLKPVLTIDSGDIVRLWTTTGNPRYFENLGVPKDKIPSELYAAFEGAPSEGRDDHTLNGPIAVRDAEIGDTVEIRIRSVELWLPIGAMSFRAKRGTLPEDFPLCLPEIKSGRIDGANLRGAGWPRCGQRPERHGTLVHPCLAIGACERDCNIFGTIPAGGEGAARRTPRHDQGIPVGSSR